jgi:hypothetical protein
MNSKAANHPSGRAISENGRMSRLHRYFPVGENHPNRTAHGLRNGSEWRINNHGNDSRNEIALRKAGEARPAAPDDQDGQLRAFGNGEGRTSYADYTSAAATGNRREFNEIQRAASGELWSSSAPPNKAELPMATRQVLRRKTTASSTKRVREAKGELLSEAGLRLTPRYQWRLHRRRNAA